MIRVSIEVCRSTSRFEVSVQAESIQRALEIVGAQNPGSALKVMFPLDPETFFVRDAVYAVSVRGSIEPGRAA